MNFHEIEGALGLTVKHSDSDGITKLSLENADKWLPGFPDPEFIYLVYADEPEWGFYTYLTNTNGDALRFSGFAWGYGGEGPRGLASFLTKVGWRPMQNFPKPHVSGVWRVSSRGHLSAVVFKRSK